MTINPDQIVALPSADASYRFGHPTTYLNTRELARLVLLRSRLGETRSQRAAEATAKRGTRRMSGRVL